MSLDLLQGLMGLNNGVAQPSAGQLQPSADPMAGLTGMPSGTIPASTPAPHASLNPGQPAKSLEETLFGYGGLPYGK